MKTITILLAIALSTGIARSQPVFSNCTGSSNILTKDANVLALKWTFESNSSYKDSITINAAYRTAFLRALFAVANSTLPAKDTIAVLNIHAYLQYNTNDILFSADTNTVWMQHLKQNILPSGNVFLDNTMTKYYLRHQYTWNHGFVPDYVILTSDTALNAIALRNKLSPSLGASYVDLNHLGGEPPSITGTLTPAYTDLIYTYGWEDCPAGCIYHHSWRFRVYNNCSVEYSGSYGDAITFVYAGLNIPIAHTEQIKVYPNPASNFFKIASGNTEPLTVDVINALGQPVSTINNVAAGQEVEISQLPAGIYFIMAYNKSSRQTFKIIKH